VGVDVERADSARYHRRAALVQVGVAGTCVLLDAVRLDELADLDAFLADRRVVLHALENDLEPLDVLGVRPPRWPTRRWPPRCWGCPRVWGRC
jgi:ribonuclease D